jgi:hypothetical protein
MKPSKLKQTFVFFANLCVCLMLSNCNNEDRTEWDTNLLGPLATFNIGVSDLIADSLIVSDPEQPVFIRYIDEFNLIPIDSVLQFPDTAFEESYSTPFSFTIPAGTDIYSEDQQLRFVYKDVQLTQAILEQGRSVLTINSTVTDKLYFDYSIPKATINASPFSLNNQEIAAFDGINPSLFSQESNLSGYNLDLTGVDGNSYNSLSISLNAKLNPSGNGTNVIAGQELLNYSSTFIGLKPYYVKGFLGTSSFSDVDKTIDLNDLKKISGILSIQDIVMKLNLENSLGADFGFTINNLSFTKGESNQTIALNSSVINNEQLIARAQHISNGTFPYSPTYRNYLFNTSNSNIKDIFELIPDKINYSLAARINPLGNISSGNDFYYNTSNLKVKLTIDFPLSFSANALTYKDTIETEGFEFDEENNLKSATLSILASNTFPFDLKLKTYLLDKNKIVLDSLLTNDIIIAGDVNSSNKVEQPKSSVLKISYNEALNSKLKSTRYIVVKATMNTQPGNILLPIYKHYDLKLQLIGNGFYRIGIK